MGCSKSYEGLRVPFPSSGNAGESSANCESPDSHVRLCRGKAEPPSVWRAVVVVLYDLGYCVSIGFVGG